MVHPDPEPLSHGPDGGPPIRVCYVISHFHPRASGAERQALLQGAELARRGHTAMVVTRAIDGQRRDEVIQGVTVHRWVDPPAHGPLFGLGFVAGVVGSLMRLKGEFDLVHTHQALWESIAAGLARPLLGGRPTLIQPASSGYYGEAQEMARTKGYPLLRRLAASNTAYAAISADIERQWLALGVPPSRMIRTASGVDDRHFRPGPSAVEASLPPRPRVVFTGRLHPQKNLPALLEAWVEVASRSSANLVLVGDGPDRSALESMTLDLNIADRVHFAGAVDDPAEHLRAADAFVLPSLAEGMSNSLLEAMATALPCVASDIGGNTDLIVDGVEGLLVDPGDPRALAAAILGLIEEPSRASAIGAAARARVEERFGIGAVVDGYVSLYRRLLRGEPAGAGGGFAPGRVLSATSSPIPRRSLG